jgi:hypothetical protein
MEEFSERYFGTTIRALAANIPEFFNVDLSNLHLQADKLCRLAQALQNNAHLICISHCKILFAPIMPFFRMS